MPYENLLYEKRGRIATVTLNRPENPNAFTTEMSADILAVFDEMAHDDEVLVTVLTGAGRGFCSGHYMRNPQFTEEPGQPQMAQRLLAARPGNRISLFPWEYPKPVIGAINGHAYGAGMNLVLCCDIVLASTEARFCFPMARLGIVHILPSAQVLALSVGKAKASEMALMARPIDGEDAYRWGLANKVLPPDQLMPEAMAWAEEMASLAPISVRLIKEDLRDSFESHLNYSSNRLRGMAAFATGERAEGHRAWLEERPPVFAGS